MKGWEEVIEIKRLIEEGHKVSEVALGGSGLGLLPQTLELTPEPIDPIPEPATLSLLAAGLLGLGMFRKRFS